MEKNRDCGTDYQLSYEDIQLGASQFVGLICSISFFHRVLHGVVQMIMLADKS